MYEVDRPGSQHLEYYLTIVQFLYIHISSLYIVQ